MKIPLITAHSGCMDTPPNTVLSVLEGIKAGADIVEVDVRATKDGIAILTHDGTIAASNGTLYRMEELTLGEIELIHKENKIDKNLAVTKLDEVLEVVKDKNISINLDVKDDSCIGPMLKTVKRFGMEEWVVLSGCPAKRAKAIRENYSEFQVLLNINEALFRDKDVSMDAAVEQTCRDAVTASCCGLNIPYRCFSDELAEYARRRFLPVSIWTVDLQQHMEALIHRGVDSITTHEVGMLKGLIDAL